MATTDDDTVTETNRLFIRDVLDDGRIRVDQQYSRDLGSGSVAARRVADLPVECATVFDSDGQRPVAELDDEQVAWLRAEADGDRFLEVAQ